MIFDHAATHPNDLFVRLLRLGDEIRNGFDHSSLHLVLHGAAPIAPSVKQRMIEW